MFPITLTTRPKEIKEDFCLACGLRLTMEVTVAGCEVAHQERYICNQEAETVDVV